MPDSLLGRFAGRAVIREPLVKGMEMAKVIVINAIETAHVFLTP